jgi:hypothetical protein
MLLVNRTEKGQFPKGVSGNPGGKPKGGAPSILLLARSHAPAAIQTLAEIACKGKSESVRVTAACALLDRAYDRPAQSVEMDLKLTKNLEQMTLEELQQFRERYAALAIASPALVIEHNDTEQPSPAESVQTSDSLMTDDGEAT